MPGAFSAEYADELRTRTHQNHAGREDGASFRATMLLERGRIWEETAFHPWVLTVAEWLVGRGCLMYQSDTIVKSRGRTPIPACIRTMQPRGSPSRFQTTASRAPRFGQSTIFTRSTARPASCPEVSPSAATYRPGLHRKVPGYSSSTGVHRVLAWRPLARFHAAHSAGGAHLAA